MKRWIFLLAALLVVMGLVTYAHYSEPQYKALRKELGKQHEKAFAVEHVQMFDVENLETHTGQSILVVGDRIEAMGPDGEVMKLEGCEVIDGADMILLPGL